MQTESIDLTSIQPETLYTAQQAAKILGKTTKTLANKRTEKCGPPIVYIGKSPYYKGADLLADIMSGRVDFQQRAQPSPKKKRSKSRR